MSLVVSGGYHASHANPWGHGLQVIIPGVERALQPWDAGALSPGITAALPETSYAPRSWSSASRAEAGVVLRGRTLVQPMGRGKAGCNDPSYSGHFSPMSADRWSWSRAEGPLVPGGNALGCSGAAGRGWVIQVSRYLGVDIGRNTFPGSLGCARMQVTVR